MKTVNRKRAMYICLAVMIFFLIESITGNLFLYFDVLSLVFGFVVGWALRETFEPRRKNNANR